MSFPPDPTSSPVPPPTPGPDDHSGPGGTSFRSLAALAVASALGAAVALGGAAAIGVFDDAPPATTTVVEAQPTVSVAQGEGLSVGEIYRRAGSGVVQVTT